MISLLCLSVSFLYATAAYQVSLPLFIFWQDFFFFFFFFIFWQDVVEWKIWQDVLEPKYPWWDQVSLICHWSIWWKLGLGIYCTQILPIDHIWYCSQYWYCIRPTTSHYRIWFWLASCQFGPGRPSKLGDHIISFVNKWHCLGFMIDNKLSWG